MFQVTMWPFCRSKVSWVMEKGRRRLFRHSVCRMPFPQILPTSFSTQGESAAEIQIGLCSGVTY